MLSTQRVEVWRGGETDWARSSNRKLGDCYTIRKGDWSGNMRQNVDARRAEGKVKRLALTPCVPHNQWHIHAVNDRICVWMALVMRHIGRIASLFLLFCVRSSWVRQSTLAYLLDQLRFRS